MHDFYKTIKNIPIKWTTTTCRSGGFKSLSSPDSV
jgi:hypothetical protein